METGLPVGQWYMDGALLEHVTRARPELTVNPPPMRIRAPEYAELGPIRVMPYQQALIDRLETGARFRAHVLPRRNGLGEGAMARLLEHFVNANPDPILRAADDAVADAIRYGVGRYEFPPPDPRPTTMSLEVILNKFLALPRYEIEIVANKPSGLDTDTHIVALYHPTICTNPEEVWMHTSQLGSADHAAIMRAICMIEESIEAHKDMQTTDMQEVPELVVTRPEINVVDDAAIRAAMEDDALLEELGGYPHDDSPIQGNEEALQFVPGTRIPLDHNHPDVATAERLLAPARDEDMNDETIP